MKIIDLNILLYAVNTSFEQHHAVHLWWENTLNDEEPVGLPWVVLLGFIRISTNPRIFPQPLSIGATMDKIDLWLRHPNTLVVRETSEHWEILRELLEHTGTAANLTTDAHLAAIAINHGALLVSCDNDFSRFKNLRWMNPLKS